MIVQHFHFHLYLTVHLLQYVYTIIYTKIWLLFFSSLSFLKKCKTTLKFFNQTLT